jgi:hypothetical protein
LFSLLLGVGCGAEDSASIATAPPSQAARGADAAAGVGLAALESAQSRELFLVGLFYREFDASVKAAEASLLAAVAASDGRAQYISLDVSVFAQDPIIERLDLERIPLPALVIVAPGGGVTRTLLVEGTGAIATKTVLDALVTPAHAQVLAAFQAGKLAVLVLQADAAAAVDALVREQGASANFVAVTVDPKESFLASFEEAAALLPPSLLVLAPAGKELGRLSVGVTKQAILEILQRGAAP